jgi:hypothetical protein
MDLTAAQFCDVLYGLQRPDMVLGADHERRRTPRFNQLGWAEIESDPPGAAARSTHTVTVHDISSRGICILRDSALTPGERFVMKLKRPGKSALPLTYRVANDRQIANDLHSIGGELVDLPIPDAEN